MMKKLKKNEDFFREKDVVRMAGIEEGLLLQEESLDEGFYITKPLTNILLTDEIFSSLNEWGIKKISQFHLKDLKEEVSWIFFPFQPQMFISFQLILKIEKRKRGVIFYPFVGCYGFMDFKPSSHLKFMKCIVNLLKRKEIFHHLVYQLTDDKSVVTTWEQLGLGGIRTLNDLFNEFIGERIFSKRQFRDFGLEEISPKSEEQIYVKESVQPLIFEEWESQGKNYVDLEKVC